jgi:hypothetical protein
VFQRVFQREDRETQRHRGHKEEKKRRGEDFATLRALLVFDWPVRSGQWLLVPTTDADEYSLIQNYR